MLKTIKLYGVLAKKFGKQFKFDVANTREAMRALSTQVPGFEHFMLHAHEMGLEFVVFQDKHNIGESEIDMNTCAKVIKVVPRVMGAGGGGVSGGCGLCQRHQTRRTGDFRHLAFRVGFAHGGDVGRFCRAGAFDRWLRPDAPLLQPAGGCCVRHL